MDGYIEPQHYINFYYCGNHNYFSLKNNFLIIFSRTCGILFQSRNLCDFCNKRYDIQESHIFHSIQCNAFLKSILISQTLHLELHPGTYSTRSTLLSKVTSSEERKKVLIVGRGSFCLVIFHAVRVVFAQFSGKYSLEL